MGEGLSRVQTETATVREAQNIMNAVDDVSLGAPYRNIAVSFSSSAIMYAYGCQDKETVECSLPSCEGDGLFVCLCVACEGEDCWEFRTCKEEDYTKSVRGFVTIRGSGNLRVQEEGGELWLAEVAE